MNRTIVALIALATLSPALAQEPDPDPEVNPIRTRTIIQADPKRSLEHLPFVVEPAGPAETPEGMTKVGLEWDPAPSTNPTHLYMQIGREIREGDPEWRAWDTDTPEDPIWRINPGAQHPEITEAIQMLRLPLYRLPAAAKPVPTGGDPVKAEERNACFFMPEGAEWTLRIRYIAFIDQERTSYPFEAEEWTDLEVGPWSGILRLIERERLKIDKPSVQLASGESVNDIAIEVSTDLEEWETVLTYRQLPVRPKEFVRVTGNGLVLATNGP